MIRPFEMGGMRLCGALALCLALLMGCATPQADRLASEGLIRQNKLELDVPFVAQTEDTCGPATLAMALQFNGATVQAGQLELQTFIPGRRGSLQAEMLATTRRNGFLAYRLPPRMSQIVRELEANRPVVVLVNLAYNWYPRWHYAVVTGYDVREKAFILHSGTQPRQSWPWKTFERLWARSNNWAFLALKPGEFPADVEEATYIAAALDLERTSGLGIAAPAYHAALVRWPNNVTALIGAGNALYEANHKQQAAERFRQALFLQPNSIAAANNLAQTLLDLGQLDEARKWAKQAIANGGGDDARATLESIESSMKPAAL